ncbi:MAG TPA: hypothetical protein VFR18_01710 [Terriglobia bacterium]|nr:hypothetical protein [Terriglobia bacterium]
MKAKVIGIIFLLILGGFLALRPRESEDPLTGNWIGTWGTTPVHRMDITVELRWDGKSLTGTVNSGEQVIEFKNSSFDPRTGAVHLEADALNAGNVVHYVINGKVDGRAMFGTWKHGVRKGDFKLLKT